MDKSGIYLIRNVINDKKYVGSTGSTVGFKNRWSCHNGKLNNNKHPNYHLQQAWNKYGKDSFEFTILEECADNMLEIREQAWMDYYDSMNSDKGYNLKEAGNYVRMTEETKKKLSIIKTGKKLSEFHRQRISEGNKGVRHSEEHKKALSIACKGKKHRPHKRINKIFVGSVT